eukprot:gene12940-14270_t
MISEDQELQLVRDEIRKLYDMNKKVIVAPCRCKLYISRSTEIIDYEGKTSPNWFYFATGLTTIVYDPQTNDLMLTLFDATTVRLLWMLKMTATTHIYAPNSSFHVINTKADYSEHVGLLYDCKEIASLLLNTFSLLTSQQLWPRHHQAEAGADNNKAVPAEERRRPTRTNSFTSMLKSKMHRTTATEQGEAKNDRKLPIAVEKKRRSLLRSLTFHVTRRNSNSKPSSVATAADDRTTAPALTDDGGQVGNEGVDELISTHHKSTELVNTDSFNSLTNTNNDQQLKRKEHHKRRKRLTRRSKTVGPESIPSASTFTDANLIRRGNNEDRNSNKRCSVPCFIVDEVEDIFPSRERINAVNRKSSRDSASSKSSNKDVSETTRSKQNDAPRVELLSADGCQQKRESIFRRTSRKLTRSLSEKSPHRPHVTLRGKAKHQAVTDSCTHNGDECRSCKPRASSDSLLLKGSAIDCMVETGHMAKYQRERKMWMTILENETVQTTDLCVTEL